MELELGGGNRASSKDDGEECSSPMEIEVDR